MKLQRVNQQQNQQQNQQKKTLTKNNKSKLKLQQKFINKTITNKKDINNEIFWDYFKYQNPSFLAKDLIRATQAKNEQTVNNINDRLIVLRNDINRKETPGHENPKKVVETVEEILDFNRQQQDKGIKILTPKQMLQRLPIVLAQVKAGKQLNTDLYI